MQYSVQRSQPARFAPARTRTVRTSSSRIRSVTPSTARFARPGLNSPNSSRAVRRRKVPVYKAWSQAYQL